MKIILTFTLFISLLNAEEIFKPLPTNLTYDKSIVNLGKELFSDPLLSKNKDVSCLSCHGIYGADNKIISFGTKKRKGFMNAPSVFNIQYHTSYFWNGRSRNLQNQMTDGPLFNKHEMANDEKTIIKRLNTSSKYQKLFKKAYNHKPTFKKMLDAIVEFEKTLISIDSKFDKYLRDEIKLSKDERKGLELFKSYGCISCHNGINIGANSYQKFGTVIPYNINSKKWQDRYDVTNNKENIDVFKVPSLRNVAKTAPYFHDGSVKTLKEAIYKMAYHNVGTILNDDEIKYIESFLITLTGKIPETFVVKK